MEAEPEMFGAAVAAPEGSTQGSSALSATWLERPMRSSLSSEVVPAAEDLAPSIDAELSGHRRSASATGRAVVGGIALIHVIWWALLAYMALQLFVP